MLGSIDLSGLEFSREFELGEGIRVIAIATSLAGGLATFRPDASAIATTPTGKIVSIQLFDLDEDDISEVLLDELDGKGTGVVSRSFVLYLAGRDGIREAWRRSSYRAESSWDPGKTSPAPTVETRNFVRFDPGGSGRPPRLAYLPPASKTRSLDGLSTTLKPLTFRSTR